MRAKILLALVCVMGLAVGVGHVFGQEAPKGKPVPPGMVSVPSGEFTMGLSADDGFKECQKFYGDKCIREAFKDEEPVHKVYLDAYFIDKYEVTQGEYDKCVAVGKCKANQKMDGVSGPRQPVVMVSWEDAGSYCSWAGEAEHRHRLPLCGGLITL